MVEQQHEVEGDLTASTNTQLTRRILLAMRCALLVLTRQTVAAAFVNLGPFNPVSRCSSPPSKRRWSSFSSCTSKAQAKAAGAIVVSASSFRDLIALSLADYMTRS